MMAAGTEYHDRGCWPAATTGWSGGGGPYGLAKKSRMPWTATTKSLSTPAMASGVNCCGAGGGDSGGCWVCGWPWPWSGVVPGAGEIDTEREAVALGDAATALVESVVAAVGEALGSGGCGGGGFGGEDDMVVTRVADTKVLGARVLSGLGRRQ